MANPGTRMGRNELCACGSGKKFKRCCGAVDVSAEDPASRFFGVAAVLAGLMLVAGVVVFANEMVSGGGEKPRQVWSEEHGHYHTVGGDSDHAGGGDPGKVWSEEHGHWHDAADGGKSVHVDTADPSRSALGGLREAELEQARRRVEPGAD